ncbi:serine/threonine-protein kinase STY46-like isoform X4 [Zingiber officinale]|nr:serine/threonine-protein kinase STY46-like isoform X4 [Zingiber officinale]
MGARAAEPIEEVGESSSPPRVSGGQAAYDIKNEIYKRLMESGNEEVRSNPHFKELFDGHFSRLPPRSQGPREEACFLCPFPEEEQNLDAIENIEGSDDETEFGDAFSSRHGSRFAMIHEILFSTLDKPKLLSQMFQVNTLGILLIFEVHQKLSTMLSDIGLNIREAHVFSTTDGYSLDVFVVDGWHEEDTDGLHKEIESVLNRNEGSWSGSSHSSASERILAVAKAGEWEIDRRSLKTGEKIASGSCGDLYRGSYLGQDVAIKIIRSNLLNDSLLQEFQQEVFILKNVQHENVVRFVGACTKPPQLCIVTEYMQGGNLYDYLHKQHNILELSMLLKISIDVCKGMEYLHNNNIVHRDLKTANLLIDSNFVVKVADFGVARIQNQGGVMTAETGTYRWMAPEVINHLPYDEKADVFSFGIVLWELTTSKIPYENMTPLQAALAVRQGHRPEIPETTHPRLSDLMRRCWEGIPTERPTFSEIVVELEELLE